MPTVVNLQLLSNELSSVQSHGQASSYDYQAY